MEYRTIFGDAVGEFEEKRSRFIGYIRHVEKETEAQEMIQALREKHWDATHKVYAYILRDGQTKRYTDDGEPQGTAGIPVLDVLQKEGLTDVCVVVIRYFGGTMLGAGGLVRAYSAGAKVAVDSAEIQIMSPCTEISLEMDYSFYGKITYILPKYVAKVLDSDFGVAVRMKILLKDDHLPAFQRELEELTAATVFPQEGERYYAHIPQQ